MGFRYRPMGLVTKQSVHPYDTVSVVYLSRKYTIIVLVPLLTILLLQNIWDAGSACLTSIASLLPNSPVTHF